MAIGATSVEVKIRVLAVSKAVTAVVTLVAEPWLPYFQQPIINRAVGIMAVGAIVKNRRVLEEKGAAPFGVAAIAVLVDAVLNELRRIRRTMRIMTARAGDLSFSQRHM